MEFFDKLSETIVSAGKDVGQKAKDVSEIAKLKMDIRSKEDFVEKQYAELGKAYYEKHKDEENAETEEKTPEQEHFFLITEALGEIERMRAEVFKLQGATECPKCGAKMPQGAAFCSNCGTKMGDIVGVDISKGVWQIASVLGILFAEALYVPLDTNQPLKRKEKIVNSAGINLMLT